MYSSQAVLGLVIGIGIFLVLIFYFRRFSGIRSDIQLDLRGKKPKNSLSTEFSTMSHSTYEAAQEGQSKAKNLNVLFMYNGHSFDANEVLGIPAGANIKMVELAYQKMLMQSSPESKEFIESAYLALKYELRKSK